MREGMVRDLTLEERERFGILMADTNPRTAMCPRCGHLPHEVRCQVRGRQHGPCWYKPSGNRTSPASKGGQA